MSRGARLRRDAQEWTAQGVLGAAAASSVLITLAIVAVLLYESSTFFKEVTVVEFLTGTKWAPLFNPPKFGILPLVTATFVTASP